MANGNNPNPNPSRWQRFKFRVRGQNTFSQNYGLHTHRQMMHDLDTNFDGQPVTPELEGRLLKRAGKALNKEHRINQGRSMQYQARSQHLTPQQMLVQHPSAFLRNNTIRSNFVQDSGNPGANQQGLPAATGQHHFQLVTGGDLHEQLKPGGLMIPGDESTRNPGSENITDGNHTQRRQAHYMLINSGQGVPQGTQTTPQFQGGYLPMVQSTGQHQGQVNPQNVQDYPQGRLTDQHLQQAPAAFTTELSGCTIVRHQNALLHLRPGEEGGDVQQQNLNQEPTFGRQDYLNSNQTFVMFRRKANGQVKAYWQSHNADGTTTFGKRYLQ